MSVEPSGEIAHPWNRPPDSSHRREAVLRDPGNAIEHEFIRQWSHPAVALSERALGAEAVLSGTVTEYKPNEKLLVVLGTATIVAPNGASVVQSNPVIALSMNPAASPRWAVGNHPQIVSELAIVGLQLRLVDARSGALLWRDETSYEQLDARERHSGGRRALGSILKPPISSHPAL